MRRARLIALSIILGGLLSACGADASKPANTDPIFAGLDPAVVQEVIASPVAADRVSGLQGDQALTLWQGMVRNFTLCRSGYQGYKTWVKTGQPVPLVKQPAPTHPGHNLDTDEITLTEKAYRQAIQGGDISSLRGLLTNDSGCGSWVPAEAGNANGPTIAQAVKKLS